jgi:hypothetical protein
MYTNSTVETSWKRSSERLGAISEQLLIRPILKSNTSRKEIYIITTLTYSVLRRRLQDNIKMDLREIKCTDENAWIWSRIMFS